MKEKGKKTHDISFKDLAEELEPVLFVSLPTYPESFMDNQPLPTTFFTVAQTREKVHSLKHINIKHYIFKSTNLQITLHQTLRNRHV